ncbi:PREDICTED: uncharacterized protein LOC104793846 [Camelina sativa]|uniref:Uncharacterized protein LOC104793846 n=1 Tax=Camelina sativa TaxID=90675 RepID=A0ABM0ZPA1_CAMSA|nr:PREDICTED: uncharacterized protein LOC104793846 [Camelina sativa]
MYSVFGALSITDDADGNHYILTSGTTCSGGWTIPGLDLHNPRLLGILRLNMWNIRIQMPAELRFFLMALLLLRHALTITDDADGEEDDPSSILYLLSCSELLDFFFHAISWLGPSVFYNGNLMQTLATQEAAALATQFALVLQSGQPRTVHFTVSPGPPSSSIAHATTSTQQQDDDPV